MTNKKELTQLAFAALLAAASLPVDGQAGQVSGTQETYLAALGGCGSKCGAVADNAANTDSYNANSNSYQTGNTSPSTRNASYNTTDTSHWNTTGSNNSYKANPSSNDKYSNTGRATAQPNYTDTYRTSSYEVDVYPKSNEYAPTSNKSDTNWGNYNRTSTFTKSSTTTLTESQLLPALNPEARAIYMSLDAEGKAIALQLASQNSYSDKNAAIKEAQRKMNERNGMMTR